MVVETRKKASKRAEKSEDADRDWDKEVLETMPIGEWAMLAVRHAYRACVGVEMRMDALRSKEEWRGAPPLTRTWSKKARREA